MTRARLKPSAWGQQLPRQLRSRPLPTGRGQQDGPLWQVGGLKDGWDADEEWECWWRGLGYIGTGLGDPLRKSSF